jgi:hypothetical protein
VTRKAAELVALMLVAALPETGSAQLPPAATARVTAPTRDCAARSGAAAGEQEAEIVVCGRREGRSPYRVPESDPGFDPSGTVDSVSRERHRLLDLGATGIQSCSAVGPGGWTGCDLIRWREAQEQYGGGAQRGERALGIRVGPSRPDD